MSRETRGIHELYSEDPLAADWKLFGRKSCPVSRRGFLSGLAGMSAVLGAEVVFGANMPAGMIPASPFSTTDR